MCIGIIVPIIERALTLVALITRAMDVSPGPRFPLGSSNDREGHTNLADEPCPFSFPQRQGTKSKTRRLPKSASTTLLYGAPASCVLVTSWLMLKRTTGRRAVWRLLRLTDRSQVKQL